MFICVKPKALDKISVKSVALRNCRAALLNGSLQVGRYPIIATP
jgi:hypothetical protein